MKQLWHLDLKIKVENKMHTPDVTACILKQYHTRGSVVILDIITSVLQLGAEYNHAMPMMIVIITTLSFV